MKKKIATIILIASVLIACKKENEQPVSNDGRLKMTKNYSNPETENNKLNSYLIATEQIGPFKLSKTVPKNLPQSIKIRKFIEDDFNDVGKSEKHLHNIVFNDFEDQVELIMERSEIKHFEDKLIEEMIVFSDQYATKEGLKVGSPKSEFIFKYENVYAWYDAIHDYAYLETDALVGVQFILEDKGYRFEPKTDNHFEEIPLHYIDDYAVIKMIKVH